MKLSGFRIRFKLTRFFRLASCCTCVFILIVLLMYANLQSFQQYPESVEEKNNVSYEDYELMLIESHRKGPGEQGRAVRLTGSDALAAKKFENQNGFNTFVSDKIALDRSIRDLRYPICKNLKYHVNLPTVSIIIPFLEEHLSTLLRTVITALKRTKKELIKEIILVDDGSTRPFLGKELDDYLATHYPDGKVRVLRLGKRTGLINARIEGAKIATGDVLVFLDSHCEPNPNWLVPLLDPIARDYKTVTCPFIDVIDGDTFEYRAQDEGARGAFDWQLYYKRLPRLPEDAKHPHVPFESPVMAGGLFAISARWFWELGGYDPGIIIWGGEQYEISFKLWMCGGKMLDIPCSRVGHIYRVHPTNFASAGVGDFLGRNYKRLAEVWMDEYKEYIYNKRPYYRDIDPGDLTAQLDLRNRLNCKTFDWFMKNVAFDLTKHYPMIDPIPAAVGDIRLAEDPTLCIDAMNIKKFEPIGLNLCLRKANDKNTFPAQNFEHSFRDDIRVANSINCFDMWRHGNDAHVNIYDCHHQGGNQLWKLRFAENDKANPVQIVHEPTGLCLEADVDQRKLVAKACELKKASQLWIWQTIQVDKAAESRKKAGI